MVLDAMPDECRGHVHPIVPRFRVETPEIPVSVRLTARQRRGRTLIGMDVRSAGHGNARRSLGSPADVGAATAEEWVGPPGGMPPDGPAASPLVHADW